MVDRVLGVVVGKPVMESKFDQLCQSFRYTPSARTRAGGGGGRLARTPSGCVEEERGSNPEQSKAKQREREVLACRGVARPLLLFLSVWKERERAREGGLICPGTLTGPQAQERERETDRALRAGACSLPCPRQRSPHGDNLSHSVLACRGHCIRYSYDMKSRGSL